MIVNPCINYTSKKLEETLKLLEKNYKIDFFSIGSSTLSTPIYSVKIGAGPIKLAYFASIHANESITTNLLIKFIEDICNLYTSGSQRILNLFSKVTFSIIFDKSSILV